MENAYILYNNSIVKTITSPANEQRRNEAYLDGLPPVTLPPSGTCGYASGGDDTPYRDGVPQGDDMDDKRWTVESWSAVYTCTWRKCRCRPRSALQV